MEETGIKFVEEESNGSCHFTFNGEIVSAEPVFIYESIRDINHEEYLSIVYDEIIMYFTVRLPVSKDEVVFN